MKEIDVFGESEKSEAIPQVLLVSTKLDPHVDKVATKLSDSLRVSFALLTYP